MLRHLSMGVALATVARSARHCGHSCHRDANATVDRVQIHDKWFLIKPNLCNDLGIMGWN
jgi:hypothetical protein